MDVYSISKDVNQKGKLIIDQLDEETLSVYVFLVNVFSMGDVTENLVFQFVFRSFYQLDYIQFNPKLQQKYFQLMQKHRYNNVQPEEIFEQLMNNEKEKSTFFLTTKLLNMLQPSYPVYNCYSDYVFPFKKQHENDYIEQYNKMIDLYKQIMSENLLNDTLQLFDQKFLIYDLPVSKKLDFIFSTYGKLLKNKKAN